MGVHWSDRNRSGCRDRGKVAAEGNDHLVTGNQELGILVRIGGDQFFHRYAELVGDADQSIIWFNNVYEQCGRGQDDGGSGKDVFLRGSACTR